MFENISVEIFSGDYYIGDVEKTIEGKYFLRANIDSVSREDYEDFWKTLHKKHPEIFNDELIDYYEYGDTLSPEFDTMEKLLKWVDKYVDEILSVLIEFNRTMY